LGHLDFRGTNENSWGTKIIRGRILEKGRAKKGLFNLGLKPLKES